MAGRVGAGAHFAVLQANHEAAGYPGFQARGVSRDADRAVYQKPRGTWARRVRPRCGCCEEL